MKLHRQNFLWKDYMICLKVNIYSRGSVTTLEMGKWTHERMRVNTALTELIAEEFRETVSVVLMQHFVSET